MTSGLDGKVICWNYKSAAIVATHTYDEEILRARWCPSIPNLYGISVKSGNVILKTFQDEDF